jgi:hypothetical protein
LQTWLQTAVKIQPMPVQLAAGYAARHWSAADWSNVFPPVQALFAHWPLFWFTQLDWLPYSWWRSAGRSRNTRADRLDPSWQ